MSSKLDLVTTTEAKSTETAIPMLEEAIYPAEFLNAFTDTAFQALQDYLERTGAPKEARALLEDLAILSAWQDEVKKGGLVQWTANQFVLETVASASRNIAAIGGKFFAPSGPTPRRGILDTSPNRV